MSKPRGAKMGDGRGFYRKHVSAPLSELMSAVLDVPRPELVNLYEELAVARTAALRAIKLADPVLSGAKVEPGTASLALEVLRDAMNSVRDMCVAISRIEKDSDDKVSLSTVHLFIEQVTRAVYRACGDDADGRALAERIEVEIKDTVRLPTREAGLSVEGTEITPDMAARAMDESVAGGEEGDDGERDSEKDGSGGTA